MKTKTENTKVKLLQEELFKLKQERLKSFGSWDTLSESEADELLDCQCREQELREEILFATGELSYDVHGNLVRRLFN